MAILRYFAACTPIKENHYIITRNSIHNNKDYIGNNKEYSRSVIRNNKDITKE